MRLRTRGGGRCERRRVERIHACERAMRLWRGWIWIVRSEWRLLGRIVVVAIECSSVVCEVECFDRYIGRLTAPLRDPLAYGLIRVAVIGLNVRGRW